MSKKLTLEEMMKKYDTMPTSTQIMQIDGSSYTVVSHYTGGKDIDEVIRTLAEKQAYEAIEENNKINVSE